MRGTGADLVCWIRVEHRKEHRIERERERERKEEREKERKKKEVDPCVEGPSGRW